MSLITSAVKTSANNVFVFSIGIAIAVTLYAFVYYPRTAMAKQLERLKVAEMQAAMLRAKFKGNPVYQHVTFGAFTGLGGCLSVDGSVSTEDDIRSVTNQVGAIDCPVRVVYSLSTSDRTVFFQWYDDVTGPRWLKSNAQ